MEDNYLNHCNMKGCVSSTVRAVSEFKFNKRKKVRATEKNSAYIVAVAKNKITKFQPN